MGTRVSYPVEVKMKAIEMRLAGGASKRSNGRIKYSKQYAIEDMDALVSKWRNPPSSINQLVNNIPSAKDRNMKVRQPSYRQRIGI